MYIFPATQSSSCCLGCARKRLLSMSCAYQRSVHTHCARAYRYTYASTANPIGHVDASINDSVRPRRRPLAGIIRLRGRLGVTDGDGCRFGIVATYAEDAGRFWILFGIDWLTRARNSRPASSSKRIEKLREVGGFDNGSEARAGTGGCWRLCSRD